MKAGAGKRISLPCTRCHQTFS